MKRLFKILRALVRCEHRSRLGQPPGELCLACGAHRTALSEPWAVPGFVEQLADELIGLVTSGEELQTAREAILELLGRILDGADVGDLQEFRRWLEWMAALLPARRASN